MAVLYTTHYMEEAERLCDRIGIIDHGKLIAEGTRRELVSLVGERDRVRLAATGDLAAAARRPRPRGRGRDDDQPPARASTWSSTTRAGRCPRSCRWPRRRAPTIRTVEVTEPDLEAVFLHLTGRALRD